MAAAALTSSSITMAALLLVVVAAMAVQTAATRPAAADGYAAAAKPAEDGYAAASKPAAEQTGGEATSAGATPPVATKSDEGGYAASASSKPADEQIGDGEGDFTGPNHYEAYATSTKLDKLFDGYTKAAATATSPEKADAAKRAADLIPRIMVKTNKGSGKKEVTIDDADALSSVIMTERFPLVQAGNKSAPSYIALEKASKFLDITYKSIELAAAATSPEKIAAAKKNAIGSLRTATLYTAIAVAEAPPSSAAAYEAARAAGVPDKPYDPPSEEAVAKPAGEAYAAPKEAAPKEEPAGEAYAAPKEEAAAKPAGESTYAAPKEEAAAKPAGEAYAAPKEEPATKPAGEAYAAPKEEAVAKPTGEAYAAPKEAAPKETYA